LNRREEALESIDKALNLSPKIIDYYNAKNRILNYFGQYEEVLEILDKLIDEFPEGERNLKIKKAYILREKKDLESGLAIIDELIEKYPDDDNLMLNKAYWLQYLEEEEKVREIMQKLIDKTPNKGIYHDTFGEILMKFEDYEHAAREFEKAVKLDSEEWYINQTYVKLGICYRELDKLELAIEFLMKGKEYTNRCYCDLETKRRWLSIADLFLAEIAELEDFY
jgi:tetratricopeptide (TPR) repeat protein